MRSFFRAYTELVAQHPHLSRLLLPLLVIGAASAIFLAGRAAGEFLYFVTHP
ncbi:hypothetical protein [Deinococcus arcticus]|uniref:hypothetical protein n=1 Tax=Deinococcus arcticus TaxID=2136176 RepID=UPI001304FF10|nr:hypothetical protein [Deinococcus arcticus]